MRRCGQADTQDRYNRQVDILFLCTFAVLPVSLNQLDSDNAIKHHEVPLLTYLCTMHQLQGCPLGQAMARITSNYDLQVQLYQHVTWIAADTEYQYVSTSRSSTYSEHARRGSNCTNTRSASKVPIFIADRSVEGKDNKMPCVNESVYVASSSSSSVLEWLEWLT